MKKYILAIALFIGVSSFYNTANAQSINISINLGRQPAWGPVGYDYVGYYYFPDIDIYYDVNVGLFYYFDRGRWISARYLPYAYQRYDLYGLHKVVLNVNQPWRYNNIHRRDYAHYRGYRNQVVIRDSRDVRYRNSRNNRVTWYSDNNRHNSGRDYNKNNTPNRVNNSSDNKRKDNNSYRPGSNSRPDNKSSERTTATTRDNKRNNSQNERSNRDKDSNSRVNSSRSTSKSSDFRLASTNETRKRN